MRVPGQKRTYGVNVKAELSTKFADWIETNLLKLETGKIRRIVFDNYDSRRTGTPRDHLPDGTRRQDHDRAQRFDRPLVEDHDRTTFREWRLHHGPRAPDKEIKRTAPLPHRRPGRPEDRRRATKPPGLTDPNTPGIKLTAIIDRSLQSKGFYLTRQGLFSDQGDVIVTTDEGVVYTLRYGGPVFATGDELTAGEPDDAEKKDEPGKAAGQEVRGDPGEPLLAGHGLLRPDDDPQAGNGRGKGRTKPADPSVIPDDPFAPNPTDPKYLADQKAAKEKAEPSRRITRRRSPTARSASRS